MPVMDGLETTRRIRQLEQQLTGAEESGATTKTQFNMLRMSFMHMRSSNHNNSTNNNSNNDSGRCAAGDADKDTERSSGRIVQQSLAENLAEPDKRRTIIIGVSANSDHETMQEAMAFGMDAFIEKPFAINSFYKVYREVKEKEKEKERAESSAAQTK